MATRAKDTTPGVVKEKRRISNSPSFPRPANATRKSVNTTTTTTIAPNHIKPTKPSNADPLLKPVNTKGSSSTLSKPDLARRRSFGSRPLSQPKSPAPAANADRSPKITGTVVRPKPLTERSRSSSSLKAPASPSAKPKVATTVRKPVPGKPSRLATRPATTAVYKKKQPQSNDAAKTLKSTSSSPNRDLPKKTDISDEIVDARKSDHELETESCQDIHDQESTCSSVVDANNENDNTEMIADIVHDDQLGQTNDEAYLLSEASTVVSEIEQSEAELENKVNEVTEKVQQETANNDEPRTDADNEVDASSKKDGFETEEENMTNNETSEKISVAAAEEEKEALHDKNEKPSDNNEKASDNNEKPSDKDEKASDKEKEAEEVRGGEEQVKSEKEETSKKINNYNNSAGGSNKKESPTASNEVIEETASKLRVQRKNKVLALVGAFETVMSSQD